jgi:hypothetical protein
LKKTSFVPMIQSIAPSVGGEHVVPSTYPPLADHMSAPGATAQ